MEADQGIYQLFVKLLDSRTLVLNYTSPQISARDVKTRLSEITGVPASLQRLVTGTRELGEDSALSCGGGERRFPAVAVAARVRGGKGGFGSLLRGAGSKAWQKKTSNMDACRDMSGRRLRHVNAERRLEEWRAGEEERRLERKAEEFLRKMAKKGKRGVGDGEAEKYVAKYREDSERCVSEVLDSVKEAVKGKRKEASSSKVGASEAKRLKIWMGKQKLDESDSDDSEDEEENEKSTVSSDDNNGSDSSKDAEGSTGSVTGKKQDGELSGGGSSESGSEEEKENVLPESKEPGALPNEDCHCDMQNHVSESVSDDEKVSEASGGVAVVDEKASHDEPAVENSSTPSCRDEVELHRSDSPSLESGLGVSVEVGSSKEAAEIETPLNFDKFNSAAELEALGMERLKSELQDRGLKCGGTLQERAARLFLLKSTPLDKLPKKLLAKK